MLYSTDGRVFVFGVFEADGHECRSLVALAEDGNRANQIAEEWKRGELAQKFVTVETLQVRQIVTMPNNRRPGARPKQYYNDKLCQFGCGHRAKQLVERVHPITGKAVMMRWCGRC